MRNFKQLPLLIRAIIIVLLLAPVGNFAATFSALGLPEWYYPHNFVRLSLQVSAFDWMWNSLLFVSGVLLLLQRKLAWAVAVFALFFALAANFLNWYLGRITNLDTGFFLLTSLGSLSMLAILFYFRYPHLDRRDRWISKNERLPITVKVGIVRPVKCEAMLINISQTGALVEVPETQSGSFALHSQLTLALPTGKHIDAQVVRVTRNGIGVSFQNRLSQNDLKF